ncbi:MAG: phosphopantetheine-binding protein [Dehalococcoidales bacterium]
MLDNNGEKIRGFFAQFLDMEAGEIDSGANLRDDLEMDSTETLEFIVALEREFNIKISDGEVTNRHSVLDVVKTVEGKLG